LIFAHSHTQSHTHDHAFIAEKTLHMLHLDLRDPVPGHGSTTISNHKGFKTVATVVGVAVFAYFFVSFRTRKPPCMLQVFLEICMIHTMLLKLLFHATTLEAYQKRPGLVL
jgi:hypothetical protein